MPLDATSHKALDFAIEPPRKAARLDDLPSTVVCIQCETSKPLAEMIVVRIRREQVYRVRPRCKECHNARERGHRREWKRKYLRRWRRENAAVNESYWKGNPETKERARVNAAKRLENPEYREAVAIQRRLRNKGVSVSIDDAKEFLAKYGRCYPTRFGLTAAGLRECERIRSRLRARSAKTQRRVPHLFDIRIMVYEQSEDEASLIIPPAKQPRPFQKAAARLRAWQRQRREVDR